MASTNIPADYEGAAASRRNGNNRQNIIVVGVDIGGSHMIMLAMRSDGSIVDRRYVETLNDEGATRQDAVARRVEPVRDFIASADGHGGAKVVSVGISSAGIADRDHRMLYDIGGKLFGVKSFDWQAALRKETPALGGDIPALVLNDAHAALMAEAWLGAARGRRDAVMLTLGTGVGGAIIANGRLVGGALGRAGHIGHVIIDPDGKPDIFGAPGSLEWFFGNGTVADRTNGRFTSVKQVVEGVVAGNTAACAEWDRAVSSLAIGIASLITTLDPEVVILGGGIASAGDILLRPLRKKMNRLEWHPEDLSVPIVFARLGNDAGAIGGAAFALEHYSKNAIFSS